MRCPSCQAEFAEEPKYCSECGYNIKSGAHTPSLASGPELSVPEDTMAAPGQDALRPPSGFSRTLSTDLVARQIQLRALARLSTLIQSRTYEPGEVMIRKGEMKRDLFFLTEGLVEISRHEGDADFILNEIGPPYILGEIAFLFGMPRTATAKAKTKARTFVLKYEDLGDLLTDLPPWLSPLLTSLASDIKSLHHKAKILEKRLLEMEENRRHRT
jgi:CRP/FNR family transcriptional regulator, cyclic AMP receptor protein